MPRSEPGTRPRVLCLVWAPYSARMTEISAEIGGKKEIFTFFYGHMYLAPFRYALLFLKTTLLLARERPDVIYAQNPSIFCPLSCLPYCKIMRKKLVIDHHAVWSMKTISSGILGRAIRKLEIFVVLRTYANTTPHPLWARELEKMGARNVLTVFDYATTSLVERDERLRSKYSKGMKFIALAPHGGHPLERIEIETQAARSVDQLMLLLSGPPSKLRTRISRIDLGSNVHYIGLMIVNAARPAGAFDPAHAWTPSGHFDLFSNIRKAWSDGGIGDGIWASLLYSIVSPLLAVVIGALAGYGIVTLRLRHGF